MDKKENRVYELVADKKRIKVSEEIYRAYYKEREHEKYLEKKSLSNEYSFDGMQEEGISFEYELSSFIPSPEDIYIAHEQINELNNAISALDEDSRNLIKALFFEGLTEREYAQKLKKNRDYIHHEKNRILRKLKHTIWKN